MKCKVCAFLFCFSYLLAEGPVTQLEPFVVGTSSGYAPYVSINPEGVYEGFDIDVANELAKRLNRKLVLKDLGSMPSLMLALKQNKIDALIWAVSITQERQKNIELVYYQGEKTTTMPLVFWKQIPEAIHSLDDLVNFSKQEGEKHICVEAGTSQEGILKHYPLNLKFVDKITDAILEIKYGKSLATSLDYSLLPSLQAKYSDIKVLEVNLPPELQVLGFGIGLNQSNQELIQQVKQAIANMRSEGKLQELEKKWNLSP